MESNRPRLFRLSPPLRLVRFPFDVSIRLLILSRSLRFCYWLSRSSDRHRHPDCHRVELRCSDRRRAYSRSFDLLHSLIRSSSPSLPSPPLSLLEISNDSPALSEDSSLPPSLQEVEDSTSPTTTRSLDSQPPSTDRVTSSITSARTRPTREEDSLSGIAIRRFVEFPLVSIRANTDLLVRQNGRCKSA